MFVPAFSFLLVVLAVSTAPMPAVLRSARGTVFCGNSRAHHSCGALARRRCRHARGPRHCSRKRRGRALAISHPKLDEQRQCPHEVTCEVSSVETSGGAGHHSWCNSGIPVLPLAHFFGVSLGSGSGARPHNSDARSPLRIYIYPLPSQFHRRIIEGLQAVAGPPSECPPLRWPCSLRSPPSVKTSLGRGVERPVAIFWQYLAETIIMQKFLALDCLQVSPAEADVFVVPAFLAAGSFVWYYLRGKRAYWPWDGTFSFSDLLAQLPYYNEQTKARPSSSGPQIAIGRSGLLTTAAVGRMCLATG